MKMAYLRLLSRIFLLVLLLSAFLTFIERASAQARHVDVACIAMCKKTGFTRKAPSCTGESNCALAVLPGVEIFPTDCGCAFDDYACLGREIVYKEVIFTDLDECNAYLDSFMKYVRDPIMKKKDDPDIEDEVERVQC